MSPKQSPKIHWVIVRSNAAWCLKANQLTNKSIVTKVEYRFRRFIDALNAAQTLQVEIVNKSALPL